MKEIMYGKPIKFNPHNNEITFKLGFVTPDSQKRIENWIISDKMRKIIFEDVKRFGKTYEQQKRFWVDLIKILLTKGIEPTENNKREFYLNIKHTIFPNRMIEIETENGIQEEYYPPSMNELSLEEMSNVIQILRDRNTPVYVDNKAVFIDWDSPL